MSDIGPRPRFLPIAPTANPARRNLPLAGDARDVDRKWKPVYAVWEITLACDLACRHCGSRAGRERPDELTTEQCFDLVDQMAELGVREVTMIGGEAYLRDDWTEIAKRIVGHGMQCGITTGGRGFTAERAKAAYEAGIRAVSVSVDGLRETHDKLRGLQGSWESAMNAITNLREAGIAVSSNTQFNKASLKEIPELFDLLIEKKIRAWQVQLTVAMGRAVDEPALLLEPYQVIEVMAVLARLKPKADANKILLWPGNNIGYFGPYETLLKGNMPRGHMASCGAGRATLGIEANGDIKGCPSLPTADYVGGNIRDYSLRTIWEQSKPLRFTRDRTVEDLFGFCRDCYYNDTCRAGCSWTTHVLFGKPGNNPYCHHRALELLREGKRERIVKVSEASGQPFDHGKFEVVVEDWPDDLKVRAEEIVKTANGWLSD
ncbi:MAG: radical SAM protein [Labilithrix sp.]|nr:radical SAM protein [Labilithrix sp.]MCW5814271.1 radical SAM protein [Labilithrix sp.]